MSITELALGTEINEERSVHKVVRLLGGSPSNGAQFIAILDGKGGMVDLDVTRSRQCMAFRTKPVQGDRS